MRIEQFESPIHLMELARKPELSHLKYPTRERNRVLQEGPPMPVGSPILNCLPARHLFCH